MPHRLSPGTRIFIDSNIFIYHFLGLKEPCSQLLDRIEHKELMGFTSVVVLSEVLHRLMIAEAIEQYGLTPRKAVVYLKSHPHRVKTITRAHQAVNAISRMNITVWPLTRKILTIAQQIIHQHGLLTNDAINLATMRHYKIPLVASNDTDFERIEGTQLWKPA